MSDSNDPGRWLRRAAQDLRSVTNNLQDDPDELAEVICYTSHQACEKALKRYLLAKGQTPPHIHDLAALLTACVTFDRSLEELRESILQLNEYCVDARYPGDVRAHFDAAVADSAHRFATEVLSAINGSLNMERMGGK